MSWIGEIGRVWADGWRERGSRWGHALAGTGGLRILAAGGGGAAMYVGVAPSQWWWAPIVGLALYGLALFDTRLRVAAGLTLIFGLAYYLPLLTWSNVYVGALPWVALAAVEALLIIPSGLLTAAASRRTPLWPLIGAAAWVLGEAIRGRFPFGGFPWGGIAFTQADGPLLPAVALLGASGLAFLVAVAGFGLGELAGRAWELRSTGAFRDILGPVVVTLLPLGIGVAALPLVTDGSDARSAVVGLVQGNVPEPGLEFNAHRRAVLDMHAAESDRLAEAVRAGTEPAPALVIWPENSSDIDPYTNDDAREVIDAAVRNLGVPVLVGAVVKADEPRRNYNMGIIWDPETGAAPRLSENTYTKRHPVPFGEYMPYRDFFRLFSDKVDLLGSEFLPGDRPGNLDIAGIAVGDVICFEIVYDSIVRDVVDGGAEFLVVQTNNATFGYTNETWQQQAMSRIRAVEFGREVLVVATSGVSAVIRPDGSVESSIELFTAGHLTPTVPLLTVTTPAAVIGEYAEYVLAAAGPVGLLILAVRRRREAVSAPAGGRMKDDGRAPKAR